MISLITFIRIIGHWSFIPTVVVILLIFVYRGYKNLIKTIFQIND